MSGVTEMDWHAWHDDYDKPGTPLARRLAAVQDQIRVALTATPFMRDEAEDNAENVRQSAAEAEVCPRSRQHYVVGPGCDRHHERVGHEGQRIEHGC